LVLIPAPPPRKASCWRTGGYAPFPLPDPFRPADAIHEAWETLRAGLAETPFLTLTGYGRQLVDFADKQVTEISCHGLGARLLAPDTRTVIDIGGQDSKVIQLDAGGNLSDFLMNDKCAAGTGRFLEVISRTRRQRRTAGRHYRRR
jgi:predicted CoA-substrate-specific enzyme activase